MGRLRLPFFFVKKVLFLSGAIFNIVHNIIGLIINIKYNHYFSHKNKK